MLQLIDDQTASNYYNEIDTATGDDLQSKTVALEAWANNKKAVQARQEWDHVSKVFTDFDNYSAAEGLDAFDEESRYQYANRKFIANQTGDTPENQMFVYPSKRDEVTDKLFGKTGLSEKETFDLFKHSVESRTASEEALRELPGVLAQGVLKRAGEGKPFDEVDSWFAFSDWKDRHADKLASMPKGWETAMLDSAVKLHARTEQLMDDVAPESKRAMDTLMKFTRPEDAANLPDADRADVENLAKDFAKLTPEKREGIYATLSYAAEAGGAGMGKGFWEKVGEGMARGGGNIYDDAAITAQDRQARQNISFFQDLIDKPQAEPDIMQTADSIQMQSDMAQKGLEENKQRLGELRVMREIRDLAQGRIDPIKTEMDGVLGQVVQGAYDFSQSAAYTGMAMVPYVGLPAVMGALANSNYLRMLDQYPDMDADAAFDLSLAIAGPQAVIERFQGGLLLGKLPFLGKAMKKLTDVRVPLAARIGLGYGAVVGLETGTELIQEAMPVVADLLAAAVREDMPEFDANKAWGEYREQAPKIFYSMLWGGLMGGGAVGIRELERSGVYMRNLDELQMHGITGEAAQDIAAERNPDAATALYREAWDKRSPEDIQAGIAKRAAMLDAAQATQANPDFPTRRIEENPDGTLTHIIEKGDGTVIYRTSDPVEADMALVNITRMMERSAITGTTRGIVESLSFFNKVNEAANRGDDIQKFILENTPRNLLDEYEANPTEQNLDNLFKTVGTIGQDISEPAELANFPVLASNQGALAEGIFKSVIRIYEGATGDKVVRDVAQDNLKRAIAEGRIKMEWVRENLNQIIPLIESERNTGPALRTETDTDVIESFSDVALAYMTGRIREEQIPEGFRGFLRRMAIVVKDIFRRAYKLKRLVAEGKVDSNFESFLADSVGLNQQARVDTASNRVSKDIITDGGQMLMDFSIGSRTNAVSTDTPSIRASNATLTGPANYSISAHHGTPHKVDKFSTEKIGTGEGAQAYGWGLYFADSKAVAGNYQKALSGGEYVPIESLRKYFTPGNLVPSYGGGKDRVISFNEKDQGDWSVTVQSVDEQGQPKYGERPRTHFTNPDLKSVKSAGLPTAIGGNLYTAELDVEPEDLLDWDKSFSEQSPKVQAALKAVQSDNPLWKDTISGKNGKPVGGAIYKTLTATWPDAEFSRDGIDPKKKASEALLAAGIPGIRYLDGGSRSDGEGTYNYVAFDENLIRITEENGNRIPASQALAGPATGATNYSIGMDLRGVQLGADLAQVWNKFPKSEVSLPDLPENATPDELRKIAEQALRNQPDRVTSAFEKEVVLHDVKNIKGKAEHFVSGQYRERRPEPNRVRTLQMLAHTIRNAMAYGSAGKSRFAYIYRYNDGTVHVVIVQNTAGKQAIQRQFTITQFDHDTSKQTSGIRILRKKESGPQPTATPQPSPSSAIGASEESATASQINQFLNDVNKNFSIGIARNAISQVSEKDDASRVGTSKLGTAKVPKNTPQESNISGDNVPDELLASQMAKVTYAHLPKAILSETNPQKKRRKLINWFKKNLLALHDAFPEEFRARATHWYDGANRIAKELGSQFQASVEQASGVIAVFSPQKDWFMNVAQAEQFIELWTNSQDVVLEESLVRAEIEGIIEAATAPAKQNRKKVDGETKEQTAERREYNKALDERAKVDRRKKVEQVIGKTIRQLDAEPDLQGWAIRVLAQITFGRNYRNLSPEGDRLGMASNDDGALSKNGWGSINEIEKAVRIMKDGSLKNISDNLGNEHKVRNFYNNIVAPNTPYGDATIDTHAVAAAHLMPYGAKATEVGHNFGSGMNGSEVLGISGVYHLYLDAYREAAADRGILPRQMQSITWEAIRLVYPAATKNATTLAKSQKTWKDLTDDSARNTLVGGRIPSPVWAGANDNGESQSNPTGMGENIGQEGVSGGGLLSGVRPTGAGRDGGVNYSIASQSEIDRVNRALGGMNRGPDARLAVYERAKSKLIGLMQSNQASLDDLRKGTVSFRRTQVLQALGELDAILSIFPPDLRGRVGGYTKLASIAPHDVFKDGEKVSEVSGMNGAIISAWMREGQNIGQAGQQTELPPGYTAKENLGTARADRAISDFFKKRIEMIDRELEKTLRREYDEAFRKLLDRTKPKKAAPGEKPKGIGGDIQDLFAVVRDSVDMNATQVAAHIAGLDSMIASGELTAEQEARAQIEAALVALTGDWKNADSDRRRTALTEATRIWSGAYAAHTQKVIRQREEREIARAESIIATGKDGDMPGRASKAISDSGLKGTWKDYILNLLNFDQVVGVLFGENTEFSNTIIDKQRLAENAKEDGSQTKMQGLEDFFSGLAGGNLLAGERLRYQLTQPSMTVNDIQMSQLEGLSAVMMWAQEDGRRHMEGERDENGRPSGKWNYDQAFVDEITTNLSAEALALRDWLSQQYAAEYANINAVYSELNGVNLPQIQNYSPVTVQPVNAPAGQVLDPVSGSAMSGASTSPGALRTRGTSIAEPRFQDALQTYISHTLQMEHWKAFAPMLSEVNGILRNRDVQNSVQEKGGIEARKMLNLWLDYFGQGGNRDAGAHLALNQGLNNILGRASQVALVGRISTLLIQSTQLGAALAEVPAGPYLKRMGKLLSGQLSWDAALNSDYIQRRIKQMPPVVQMAMQGLKGAKPTAIQQAGKRLGMLLSGADGLFTAGTYAIVYDWHLSKAKELGLAGQQAEDYARNTAERATDRIAQPTRAGARSLYENTQTNPLARAGWAFASEARKNLALVAYSFAERDTATKLRTIAYVLALNAIGSQILRSIWRDTQDDDDEELFDEKYWNPKRFLMAAATEPLYGIPVFGSMLEEAVYKSAGEYNPQTSLFSVAAAVGPIKRLPDHLSGDTEMRDVFSDIDKIISSLGVMHPNIAATASITHLAKDLFGLADSAVDATTED